MSSRDSEEHRDEQCGEKMAGHDGEAQSTSRKVPFGHLETNSGRKVCFIFFVVCGISGQRPHVQNKRVGKH